MFSVLIRGTLSDAPMTRTGKTGTFVTAKMVARDGDARLKVGLIAFGSEAQQLAITAIGDQISVLGEAKLTEWTASDGSPRRGMNVTVWRLMSLGERPSEEGLPEEEDEEQGVLPF